jgi:HTH-type transcriptional regulator / antitoxin HigA
MNTALAIDYVDPKTAHRFHLPLSVFKKPSNAIEYTKLEAILDQLIDEVRDNETHPLAIVMQIIGENLEQFDNEHHLPIGHHVSDIEFIKHLMKSHHYTPTRFSGYFRWASKCL